MIRGVRKGAFLRLFRCGEDRAVISYKLLYCLVSPITMINFSLLFNSFLRSLSIIL